MEHKFKKILLLLIISFLQISFIKGTQIAEMSLPENEIIEIDKEKSIKIKFLDSKGIEAINEENEINPSLIKVKVSWWFFQKTKIETKIEEDKTLTIKGLQLGSYYIYLTYQNIKSNKCNIIVHNKFEIYPSKVLLPPLTNFSLTVNSMLPSNKKIVYQIENIEVAKLFNENSSTFKTHSPGSTFIKIYTELIQHKEKALILIDQIPLKVEVPEYINITSNGADDKIYIGNIIKLFGVFKNKEGEIFNNGNGPFKYKWYLDNSNVSQLIYYSDSNENNYHTQICYELKNDSMDCNSKIKYIRQIEKYNSIGIFLKALNEGLVNINLLIEIDQNIPQREIFKKDLFTSKIISIPSNSEDSNNIRNTPSIIIESKKELLELETGMIKELNINIKAEPNDSYSDNIKKIGLSITNPDLITSDLIMDYRTNKLKLIFITKEVGRTNIILYNKETEIIYDIIGITIHNDLFGRSELILNYGSITKNVINDNILEKLSSISYSVMDENIISFDSANNNNLIALKEGNSLVLFFNDEDSSLKGFFKVSVKKIENIFLDFDKAQIKDTYEDERFRKKITVPLILISDDGKQFTQNKQIDFDLNQNIKIAAEIQDDRFITINLIKNKDFELEIGYDKKLVEDSDNIPSFTPITFRIETKESFKYGKDNKILKMTPLTIEYNLPLAKRFEILNKQKEILFNNNKREFVFDFDTLENLIITVSDKNLIYLEKNNVDKTVKLLVPNEIKKDFKDVILTITNIISDQTEIIYLSYSYENTKKEEKGKEEEKKKEEKGKEEEKKEEEKEHSIPNKKFERTIDLLNTILIILLVMIIFAVYKKLSLH